MVWWTYFKDCTYRWCLVMFSMYVKVTCQHLMIFRMKNWTWGICKSHTCLWFKPWPNLVSEKVRGHQQPAEKEHIFSQSRKEQGHVINKVPSYLVILGIFGFPKQLGWCLNDVDVRTRNLLCRWRDRCRGCCRSRLWRLQQLVESKCLGCQNVVSRICSVPKKQLY